VTDISPTFCSPNLSSDVFALFFFICRRLLPPPLEGDDENESEERTTRVVVLFVLLFVDENIECTWQRFRRREENDKNQTRTTKDVYDYDEYECE
jgi:hypothetical protein